MRDASQENNAEAWKPALKSRPKVAVKRLCHDKLCPEALSHRVVRGIDGGVGPVDSCEPQVVVRYTVVGHAGPGRLNDAEIVDSSYSDPYTMFPAPIDRSESTITVTLGPGGEVD
jgi:hypothetical protein